MTTTTMAERLREVQTTLVLLLEELKQDAPHADGIGLRFDEMTGTWVLALGEYRLGADGYEWQTLSQTAGMTPLDAYETVKALAEANRLTSSG